MKSNVSIVVLVASVIADLNLQGIFKVLRRIDRINKMFSDSVIDIVGFDSCPEEVRL